MGDVRGHCGAPYGRSWAFFLSLRVCLKWRRGRQHRVDNITGSQSKEYWNDLETYLLKRVQICSTELSEVPQLLYG